MNNILLKLTIFTALSILFFACKPVLLEKEEKTSFEIRRYQTTEAGVKQGKWARYDSTGKVLLEEAFYDNDSLEGESKLYDLQGKIAELRHYKKGKLEGEFKSYYSNGQVNSDATYINNKFEGTYKRYYANGKLREMVQFKEGHEDGAFQEFYMDGSKKTEGSYKFNALLDTGVEDGALLQYDSASQQITKKNCAMGRCSTVE